MYGSPLEQLKTESASHTCSKLVPLASVVFMAMAGSLPSIPTKCVPVGSKCVRVSCSCSLVFFCGNVLNGGSGTVGEVRRQRRTSKDTGIHTGQDEASVALSQASSRRPYSRNYRSRNDVHRDFITTHRPTDVVHGQKRTGTGKTRKGRGKGKMKVCACVNVFLFLFAHFLLQLAALVTVIIDF